MATAGTAADTTVAVETHVPVRDETLLYVRYGPPGAVRIQRTHGVSDSLWALYGDPVDSLVSGPATQPESVWVHTPVDLVALRRVLQEELAGWQRAPGEPGEPGVYAATDTGPSVVPVPVPTGGRDDGSPSPGVRSGTEVPATNTVGTTGGGGGSSVAPIPIPIPIPVGGGSHDTLFVTASPDTVYVTVPSGEPGGSSVVPVPVPIPVTRETVLRRFVGEGLLETHLIVFETGRADVLPYSAAVLDVIATVLRDFPQARIRVEGHTDDIGSEALNQALSERRAEAVVRYLTTIAGLEATRLEWDGFGESRPLAPNTSPTLRTLNRRVGFRVLNPEALQTESDD